MSAASPPESHDLWPKRGAVVLVHWTGETNYPLSGDEAAALFIQHIGSSCVVERADRYRQFRLDVLSRR